MDGETWLTAKECLEYGFCDQVEEEKQIAASIDRALLTRYKNTQRNYWMVKAKPRARITTTKLLLELEL